MSLNLQPFTPPYIAELDVIIGIVVIGEQVLLDTEDPTLPVYFLFRVTGDQSIVSS